MVASTRVLTRLDLESLFPDSAIYTEYALGLPKSYAAFHIAKAATGTPGG
jgi:hypothetical protein